MANSIFDLYLKYRNRVQRSLESDQYYNYLFEMIAESPNTIAQTNRVLHKTVDEKWLTAVENTLEAIGNIIGKPRRFIKSVETLVPLDLAKKINGQSVRHLSQHTQFIAGVQDGMVMPDKILNVENEESFDLYENRFVATLIKKLVVFIDKRTDVIFWSTGDERESALRMDSVIDDDYEQIEYKLEMVVHSKQSYMENDSKQMETFKRIDRVRRIIMDFNRSQFMAVMKSLPPVRPPIQRTNMLTKEPNYRKCFELWRFLEGYTDVGYSIDIKETALDFDEEYLFQLYSNLALNYTVFKSILDADPRRIEEAPAKRRKTVKPKFIKQIVEEFVDDYDIPDVEIRKVIIEEITKAQAEIEKKRLQKEKEQQKKAKERERLRLKKEKERAAAQKEKEKERLRLQQEKDAQRKAKLLEAQRERLRLEREKQAEQARLQKQKAREAEKLKLQRQKEAEKLKLQKQKAQEAEKLKLQKQKAQDAEKLKLQKQKEAEKLQLQKQKEAEKARLQKQKEAEKLKLQKQKAQEAEKLKLQKQKAQEAEKLKLQKQKEAEKLKLQKQKEAEKLKLQKQKEAEKARLQKQKEAEKLKLQKQKETEKAKLKQKKGTSAQRQKQQKTDPSESAPNS